MGAVIQRQNPAWQHGETLSSPASIGFAPAYLQLPTTTDDGSRRPPAHEERGTTARALNISVTFVRPVVSLDTRDAT